MTRRRSDDEQEWGVVNGERVPLDSDGRAIMDSHIADPDPDRPKGKPANPIVRWFRIFVVVAAILLVYQYVLRPLFEGGFGMADTRDVPGDPARFDPVATYAAVRDYAGTGAQLISIDAYYVRSDGTLDLTATYTPGPNVTYRFVQETNPPADAPPVGAGGGGAWYEPVSIDVYQPGQWRSVTRIGGGSSTKYSYMNRGMDRDTSSPTTSPGDIIPEPVCSFADLWQTAIEREEAPTDAVAIINYDSSGYRFYISGVSISMDFDRNCKPRG